MNKAKVTVGQLANQFDYNVVVGDETALKKEIKSPETNRPGLELVGYYEYVDFHQAVILGRQELKYIEKLCVEEQRKCFDFLTDKRIPYILITRRLKCPDILFEIAKAKSFPVLSTEKNATIANIEIMLYIYEQLSETTLFHGTLVDVYGSGVMLCGPSGIGKSEIALELIKKGHRLIADDSVLAYRILNHLYGKAPTHLKNLLEVRGLGLIDVNQMYGVTSVGDYSEIKYIIELVEMDLIKTEDRLNDKLKYREINGIKCPYVQLPVTSGRSMADLVEVAVVNLRLRMMGKNATKDLITKYDEILKEVE